MGVNCLPEEATITVIWFCRTKTWLTVAREHSQKVCGANAYHLLVNDGQGSEPVDTVSPVMPDVWPCCQAFPFHPITNMIQMDLLLAKRTKIYLLLSANLNANE